MSEIYSLIAWAIVISLVSAFSILLISKIGVRNIVVEKAPRLISEMFDCDFCLSFWLSLILAVILAIIIAEPILIIAPFISTPITRILL